MDKTQSSDFEASTPPELDLEYLLGEAELQTPEPLDEAYFTSQDEEPVSTEVEEMQQAYTQALIAHGEVIKQNITTAIDKAYAYERAENGKYTPF